MRAPARRLTVVGSSLPHRPLPAPTGHKQSTGASLNHPQDHHKPVTYSVRGNWQQLLPVHPPPTYVD